jgi:hypothetical protein
LRTDEASDYGLAESAVSVDKREDLGKRAIVPIVYTIGTLFDTPPEPLARLPGSKIESIIHKNFEPQHPPPLLRLNRFADRTCA